MTVTIVAGPPGAGKTTYVHEHAEPGDLIVDYDALYAALSHRPMYERPETLRGIVSAVREAVLQQVAQLPDSVNAWVIRSAPKAADRRALRQTLGARSVVLPVPREIATERIRETRPAFVEGIERWWNQYEPDEGDEIFSGERPRPRSTEQGGGTVGRRLDAIFARRVGWLAPAPEGTPEGTPEADPPTKPTGSADGGARPPAPPASSLEAERASFNDTLRDAASGRRY